MANISFAQTQTSLERTVKAYVTAEMMGDAETIYALTYLHAFSKRSEKDKLDFINGLKGLHTRNELKRKYVDYKIKSTSKNSDNKSATVNVFQIYSDGNTRTQTLSFKNVTGKWYLDTYWYDKLYFD